MSLTEQGILAIAFAGWCVGVWSSVRAMALGRQAASHLDRHHRDNYLRNLLLAPGKPWVKDLLEGSGLNLHAEAAAHVRRTYIAAFTFCAGAAGAVIASLIRHSAG